MVMVNIPSNFLSGSGLTTVADVRATTLEHIVSLMTSFKLVRSSKRQPRLAQRHVRHTVVVSERELQLAKSVEWSPIDAKILSESLIDEFPFVERRLGFSRHNACLLNIALSLHKTVIFIGTKR